MNVNLLIKNEKLTTGSVNRRCPNINKIKKLGYKKKYSLKKGLIETINWYLKN